MTWLSAGEPVGLAIVGDLVSMQPTVISPISRGCRMSRVVTALSSISAAEVGWEVETRHRILLSLITKTHPKSKLVLQSMLILY